MKNQSSFESRLSAMLSSYASAAPVEVDAASLAATIARREDRTIRLFGVRFVRPRWLTPLLVTALLVLALATAVLIGAQLLRTRSPVFVPLSIKPAGFMSQQRGGAVALRLDDGRVLVVGGRNGFAGANASYAEIYDPATRAFVPTGSAPPIDVRGQAATLLPDGRVLITGGYDDAGSASAAALLYDPEAGDFVQLAGMASSRANHASVLMRDGRVALIGGARDVNSSTVASPAVEYFDERTLTFSTGPDPAALRQPSMFAFAADGGNLVVLARASPLAALVLDAASQTVGSAAPPTDADIRGALVVGGAQLPDGRVVVAVGDAQSADVPSDGHLDAIVELDTRATVIAYQSLPGPVVVGPTALADGRVLMGIPAETDCTNVIAYLYSPFDQSLEPVGQIGGIGACADPTSATVTALDDGGALIAGGYMSYGGESSAASLVHP